MYTAFYGLREKPFSLSPNPRFLFLAESHREALAHLLYGIDEGEGFIAITGEVGTGKTTICRTLLERLGTDTEVAFLFNPSGSPDELLRAITGEFGLEVDGTSPAEMRDDLNRFLLERKRENRRVLLIVDEAQNLSAGTLEQVRLLSNLETASSKLIQILLLGQPELDRKLETTELRQLRQRIGVRWRLAPLSLGETGEYIRYRLRIAAGVERDLFSPGAVREVHRRSGGVPRLINILCDRSLLAGYAGGERLISRKTVRGCAKEVPAAAGRKVTTASSAARTSSRTRLGLALTGGALAVLIGLSFWSMGMPEAWAPVREAGSPSAIDVAAAPPPAAVTAAPARAEEPGSRFVSALPATPGPRAEANDAFTSVAPPSKPVALDRNADEVPALLASIAPIAPVADAPARGILGTLLAQQDRVAARTQAVDSILAAYELSPLERTPRSEAEALGWLEDAGLAVLPVYGADLALLRVLNYPVLLRLYTDDGEARLVAMRRLGNELGLLYGATGRGELEVQVGEIEASWSGRAFVVWRGFESLPDSLRLGESGVGVLWLQDALRELGLFRGEPSGLFDQATEDGVRELQISRSLEPDGVAGPRTLMVLYRLLERYEAPDLVAQGQAG
jgi:general secretion pathway protein A